MSALLVVGLVLVMLIWRHERRVYRRVVRRRNVSRG